MSTATADMLFMERHTSLYGPRKANGAPEMERTEQDDFSNDPFPLNCLDEIATLVRSLTYGEMMELAAALWTYSRPGAGGDELTQNELPGMWHRWSANRD